MFNNVQYSKKQWEIAQSALQVGQRAFITIGRKDGTVAEFISSKDPKQKAELIIYFQNSGRLPAQLSWGNSMGYIGLTIAGQSKPPEITFIHPFKMIERTRNRKTGEITGQGLDTVVAGDSIFKGVMERLQKRNSQTFLLATKTS